MSLNNQISVVDPQRVNFSKKRKIMEIYHQQEEMDKGRRKSPKSQQDFSAFYLIRNQLVFLIGLFIAICIAFLAAGWIALWMQTPETQNVIVSEKTSKFHQVITYNNEKLTTQKDIFIGVKTSGKFHESRLRLIVDTWFQLARDNTWFFTDREDLMLQVKTFGHLKVTGCQSSHKRQDLCCKMAAEVDAYLASGKRWFCHFDDDNYVNIPALARMLRRYDHEREFYLGKTSIPQPLEILVRDSSKESVSIRFATGGAGFCLSRALAVKMQSALADSTISEIGEKIRLPDDVTMGYIVEHLLKTPLTVIEEFHSHLEPLQLIGERNLENQISFSYAKYGGDRDWNIVNVSSGFTKDEDPTRFKSIHCQLFPNFKWCPQKRGRTPASRST